MNARLYRFWSLCSESTRIFAPLLLACGENMMVIVCFVCVEYRWCCDWLKCLVMFWVSGDVVTGWSDWWCCDWWYYDCLKCSVVSWLAEVFGGVVTGWRVWWCCDCLKCLVVLWLAEVFGGVVTGDVVTGWSGWWCCDWLKCLCTWQLWSLNGRDLF